MTNLFRHISLLAIAMFVLAACSSGKHDPAFPDYDEKPWEGGGSHGEETMLVVNINTLDNNANTSTQSVPEEKIKTVRLVIVNKNESNPIIECNYFIEVPEIPAAQFSYTVRWPTVSGEKEIYVFANEASVTFSDEEKAKYEVSDMTAFLNTFRESSAEDFKDWVTSFSFAPQYKTENNNTIYLPYTSYYDNITAIPGEVNTITAYLVPVATKFVFNFMNYRDYPVNVNEISVSKINKSNYFFARVGEEDYKKSFDGVELYWIDWLAKVSEESWKHQGFYPNEEFNSQYGWISDYEVPADDSEDYVFVTEAVDGGEGNNFSVPGVYDTQTNTTSKDPGKYSVGPFYVPESKYSVNSNNDNNNSGTDNKNEQEYYLTLGLEDTNESKTAPQVDKVAIPNLKALFRNTYVIINVKMSQGDVEAYAVIQSWTMKEINGWVVEGTGSEAKPELP